MDFALYNTPVIDFTRWKEEAFSARKVLGIVTGAVSYTHLTTGMMEADKKSERKQGGFIMYKQTALDLLEDVYKRQPPPLREWI